MAKITTTAGSSLFARSAQQSQQSLALLPALGAEQFLRLVDRDDDGRRPLGLVAGDALRHRRLDKFGQQRPQRACAGL